MIQFLFGLEVDVVPQRLILDQENGGIVDGSAWDSKTIKEKIYILFYIDIDTREMNEPLNKALEKQKFDKTKVGYIAIINLKATWLPNFMIRKLLQEKQKQYPEIIYVMDKNKILVNQWNLADETANVLVFDHNGTLLFQKSGKLSDDEIKQLLQLVENKIQTSS